MTPFKFGKKNKSKDKGGTSAQGNASNTHDSAFSSPASNKGNDSPTFSNYSNNSNAQRNQAGLQGNLNTYQFNSPGNQPSNFGNSPGNQQTFRDQGVGIVYDQNNNYHAKSPQKFPQQNTPGGAGFHGQPSPGQGGPFNPQQGTPNQPPHPQYGQPLPPNAAQQQQQQFQQNQQKGGQQGLQGLQGPPPQRATFKSPWTRSKLLISPFPRYRHAASSHANEKGEVFVMGGLHNTSVYGDTWILKPDPESRQFQSFQVDIYDNSPAPRVGHASTLCGNAYVLFGGDTVTNEAGEIDNDLYLFNMNSHAWTVPTPIGKKPSGRYGHTIGVIAITNYDSKLYLYGGQLDDVIFNDLAVFNLSSFRRPDVHWEWVNPSDNIRPPPLTNHSMDVYDNKLWLFGGSTGKKLSSELWCFDPELERWDQIKTLGQQPKPVEEHASVIYKDLLIIYGGKNSEGEAVGDLHILNLITKTWFKFPANFPLEPQGKYGHTLSILKNDKLLILGGHLPDYANLGENLEVSNIDNGVGTVLNILDLSNLTKLVPGLQQYSTPNRVPQDRFPNQHPNQQQALFTPQKTPQGQQQISPEQNAQGSTAGTTPGARGLSSSGAGYSPEKHPLPDHGPSSAGSGGLSSSNGIPGAAGAVAGGAAALGAQNLSKSSHNEKSLQSSSADNGPISATPSENDRPPFQKQHIPRQYSAEDVFQRERNITPTSQNTPQNNRLDVPPARGQAFSSPEEELPLQIPSPIKTEHSIPGAFPSTDSYDAIAATGSQRDAKSSRDGLDEFPIKSQDSGVKDQEGETRQIPGGFNDDFRTPDASPSKTSIAEDADEYLQPNIYKNEEAKQSDFLDSYVNGNSTSDLLEKGEDEELYGDKGLSKTEVGTGIAGAGVGIAGAVGAGALGSSSSALKSSEKTQQLASRSDVGLNPKVSDSQSDVGFQNKGIDATKPSVIGGILGPRDFSTTSAASLGTNSGDKEEFKKIISSLSQELENLKVSTTSQIKEASAKVKTLESENSDLKKQLNAGNAGATDADAIGTRELGSSQNEADLDENSYKRKHIKLNTDYQILNKNHTQLKSKLDEIEPLFSSNLFDIQKLNNIIKQQAVTIEESQKSLSDQQDWKLKYDDLEARNQALERRFDELSESRSKGFNDTHEEVKKLNSGLDSILSKYLSTGSDGATTGTRSLSGTGAGVGLSGADADDELTTSLRSQIDELLKENEDLHTQHKSLQGKYTSLESTQDELETLRAKVAELSKIEDNYKDSLHSVKNTSRALQVSQSELSKQKEVATKLQQELDELKIFRANRKSSRNTTPIVNDFAKKDTPKQGVTTDEDEEDFENAHYNLKIRDLQAELFITKQERDELKQDVLDLKKKLLNSSTPTGSF